MLLSFQSDSGMRTLILAEPGLRRLARIFSAVGDPQWRAERCPAPIRERTPEARKHLQSTEIKKDPRKIRSRQRPKPAKPRRSAMSKYQKRSKCADLIIRQEQSDFHRILSFSDALYSASPLLLYVMPLPSLSSSSIHFKKARQYSGDSH